MPFDAFEASGDSVKVKEESFKRGGILENPVKAALKNVNKDAEKIKNNKNLDELNKKELTLAMLAFKEELNNSIPDVEYGEGKDQRFRTFKQAYEHEAETGEDAAELITIGILNPLQNFAKSKINQIIERIDEQRWIFDLTKDDVRKVLSEVNPGITEEDVARAWDQVRKGKVKKGEDLLTEGTKAAKGGYHARIEEELRKAGAS